MGVTVPIIAGDGTVLQGTEYAPAGPRTWLLINSAMGVCRRCYRYLARHVAAKDSGVLT